MVVVGGGWDRASMRTQVNRSRFRSKLTATRWNVAIWLSKSFIALPSDAPQSFRIVGPLLFAASSSGLPRAGKVDRDAGVSKDSAAVRRVFAPPPPWPASWPARCSIGRQHQAILAQGALWTEGTEDVLRGANEQSAQVGVATFGDAQLWIALPALISFWT